MRTPFYIITSQFIQPSRNTDETNLFELLHVQSPVLTDVVFLDKSSDLVSRYLQTDNFECFLQLGRRNETVSIEIDLEQTNRQTAQQIFNADFMQRQRLMLITLNCILAIYYTGSRMIQDLSEAIERLSTWESNTAVVPCN
jgi:hypothetical protein